MIPCLFYSLIEAEGMEKTYNLKQEDIVRMAPIATNKQVSIN